MTFQRKIDVSATDKLFPLPLTSIEKFHILDDNVHFRNYIFCRLLLQGKIDRHAAETAASIALPRHPLVASRIRNVKGRYFWDFDSARLPKITWARSRDLPRDLDRLSFDEPFKFICRHDDEQTEIWMYSYHAICDGVGGLQFLADWLKVYNNIHHGNPVEHRLRKFEPQLLLHRNRLGYLKKKFLSHLFKQPVGLYGACKFIFRRAENLTKNHSETADWNNKSQPFIVGRWLDKTASEKLIASALSKNVMLNALLLAHYFNHLHQWRMEKGSGDDKCWIRVIHPFNIRDYSDRRMTATNRAAIVQIDRRPGPQDEFWKFTEALDREIRIIDQWQLSKLFLLAIRGMSLVPGMLKRSATSNKSRGTSVFTNLSESLSRMGLPVDESGLSAGNLTLEEFDLVGPIRQGTPLNMTIQQHLGRIRISLHVDPRVLSRAEANLFIDSYATRLTGHAEQE